MSTCPPRRSAALLFASLVLFAQPALSQTPIMVFAASSLTESLKSVAEAYKVKTGIAVTLSFGASSTLALQIDQGAQADIFLSADTNWMDFLQKNGRIASGTRMNLLGNQLVLIAASNSRPALRIAPHFDLAGALGNGHLALADPASIPAGRYAKAALTALGVWDSVAGKVVQAENVRVALEYVARGEAPFGVVYATDAKVEPAVNVVGIFPQDSHPAIIYPVAMMKGAAPAAKDFYVFLRGTQAEAIFKKAGFTLP